MLNYFQLLMEVELLEITLNPELCDAIPNLKFGIIHYDNIIVGESPQMLRGRLQLFQESLFFDLEDHNINDFTEIQEWRNIFKKLGKDPNRYRPSAEAIYRRIKKHNYLPSLNSATDINNFFSMRYRIPLGIYDKSTINGKVDFRIGKPNESYEGLNGRDNQLENLIVAADDTGAFGSPFVDSERTSVTYATTSALQIIYLPTSIDMEAGRKLLASLQSMFTQINGGEGRSSIISCTI